MGVQAITNLISIVAAAGRVVERGRIGLRRLGKNNAGTAPAEYAFLLIFIAIVAATGLVSVGHKLNNHFAALALSIENVASQSVENADGRPDPGTGSPPPAEKPGNGNGNGNN